MIKIENGSALNNLEARHARDQVHSHCHTDVKEDITSSRPSEERKKRERKEATTPIRHTSLLACSTRKKSVSLRVGVSVKHSESRNVVIAVQVIEENEVIVLSSQSALNYVGRTS